jgi:hypothetical protein
MQPTTLWRMRSPTGDNRVTCTIGTAVDGYHLHVVFAKGGLSVSPQPYGSEVEAIAAAIDLAHYLVARGWADAEES